MSDKETQRVRNIWDKMASKYDRTIKFHEKILFSGGRDWICSQAKGKVLEIGIGTGRNIPYYPQNIELTGVDLSPSMLDIARERARGLGREVNLITVDAKTLPFPDDHFDTVVSTLSLCSIPDDRKAIREVKRVLRPGGRFLLMEHVRSPILPVRLIQKALDPILVRIEGDHLLREPLDYLNDEGFIIEKVQRLKLGIVERIAARKSD